MYEAWKIKVFHSWRHSGGSGVNTGPKLVHSAETGTLPGVIKVSTLFPLVLEWGYKSEIADGHPAITGQNLPENRTNTEEGRARDQTRPSPNDII